MTEFFLIFDKLSPVSNLASSKSAVNEDTYRVIPEDPTTKQKNKLILLLKKIKNEGGISEEKYKICTPLVLAYLNFMDSQKSIKLLNKTGNAETK